MHIERLTVENFRKIKFVDLELPSDGTTLLGKNGEGKSSVLDAINLVLFGKSGDVPLKEGEDKGKVRVELSDGTIAERRFVRDRKGEVKLKDIKLTLPDGVPLDGTPRQYLNQLLGTMMIDPTEIMQMPGKKRVEVLKEALALDFDDLEAERQRIYDARTELTRNITLRKGQLMDYDDLPKEIEAGRDTATILADISEIDKLFEQERKENARKDKIRDKIEAKDTLVSTSQSVAAELLKEVEQEKESIREIERNINNLMVQYDGHLVRMKEHRAEKVKLQEQLGETYVVPQEVVEKDAALRIELEEGVRKGQVVERIKMRTALKVQLMGLEEEHESMTEAIEDIANRKKEILANTEFPIPAMSFDGDDVTFNGVPFKDCSTAERIRMCIAINSLINNDMQIMALREGSLLDDESYAEAKRIAAQNGYQLLIESVDQGPRDNVIVLENGEVR